MSDPLYINGRFTTTDEKVIGVEDRGFQFGDGVYEVLKFLNKRPLLLTNHFARMESGLRALGIPNPWSETQFGDLCAELARRTPLEEGILYFQVTRGQCERAHWPQEALQPTALGHPRRFLFPDAAKKERGIRVITTSDIRWSYCHIKSTNLLASVLAKRKAREAGADEALLAGGGEVREGSHSSFFAVRDSTLLTHPLGERILAGTVREQVLRLAARLGIAIEQRPLRSDEITSLDEAFMTSTTQAVMPIVEIDGWRVGQGGRGPVTLALQKAFDVLEAASSG